MFHHRHTIYTGLILGLMVLSASFFPHFIFANTAEELRTAIDEKNKEIERIKEEIRQFQKGVAETSAAARTLQEAVSRINQEIKNLNYQLSLTKTKLSKTELEIETLDGKLDVTLQNIAAQQAFLSESLRQLDELERTTLIEIFLAYNSLTQFFDVIEKNKTIEQAIKQSYDSFTALQNDLERQKKTAEKARGTFLELSDQLADQKYLEEAERKSKANLLAITKNQETQYQKLLKDREKQRENIAQEIQSIENELRRLIDPSSLPTKGKGVLLWPLTSYVITQNFGNTEFSLSTDVYKGQGHNGLDLRAPVGTQVLAAERGIVKSTGDTDTICPDGSYGKWIVIEHPNGLSTLYAHLSRIKASAGQTISRGDIIGLSGNTGYSTGAHLHFTVYASNTFRQVKTNNCGVLPAGGYINPLDYL